MLTRIERADGEVITFTYKKDGVPVAVHDFNHGESFAGTSNGNTDYGNNDTAETAVTVKNNLNVSFLLPSYLESISCRVSGDSLEFSSSPSTELGYDLSEDDFLLRIGNFSGTNSPLTYSIYQSLDYYMKLDTISGVDRNVAFSYSNNANTRLKLNSILFLTAKNGVIDHKYEFKYNSTPLPAYNSRKTDRWGYYNGVSYTVGNFGHSLYSDRVPDAALMQAEILEEIVYPTGGRTKFKYEPHTYYRVAKQFPFNLITCQTDSIAGGLRIKSITDEPFRGTAETRLFTYTQSNSPTAHSSGILSGRQVFFSSSSLTDSYYGMNSSYSFAMYSEQPLNLLSDTDGNHVTYSRVVETKGDGGYTVYTYSNHDSSFGADENPIVTLYGGPTSLSLVSNFSSGELFRGLLLSCNVYDSLGFSKNDIIFLRDYFNSKIFSVKNSFMTSNTPQFDNRLKDNISKYFCASETEKQNLLQKQYGYSDDMIKITGYPILDSTFNEKEKLILLTPGNRKSFSAFNNSNFNTFSESKFFKVYNSILNDTKLNTSLSENEFKLAVLMPPTKILLSR